MISLTSFTSVFLFLKYAINIIPLNIFFIIICCVISSTITSYFYDDYKFSKYGFVKGLQIISLIFILLILCASKRSEIESTEYMERPLLHSHITTSQGVSSLTGLGK